MEGDEKIYKVHTLNGFANRINIASNEVLIEDCEAGDWIVKGINGGFFSVKPDIFDACYEEME